MMQVTGRCIL